jgi:hypothetical protein
MAKEDRIATRLDAQQRAAVDNFKKRARIKRDSDLIELFVEALKERPYKEVKEFLYSEDEEEEEQQLLAA